MKLLECEMAVLIAQGGLLMEDALQPLGAVQQLKTSKYLVLGITCSIFLHLACALVLLGQPAEKPAPSPAVTYVDLSAPVRPAPVVAPLQETTPPKIQEPQPVPQPQPQPRLQPAPTPETLPQAQHSEAAPVQPAAAQEIKIEETRSHTTMGLGLTKGYFRSLGEGENLREGVKGYYLEMLQVINEKWWMDQQLDKHSLAPVIVNLTVARNGAIIDCYIMRGSGNPRYDRAVLASLQAASPLPPLPANFEGDSFQAPIRLVPALKLMSR
jgi:periplasmic protein TonB